MSAGAEDYTQFQLHHYQKYLGPISYGRDYIAIISEMNMLLKELENSEYKETIKSLQEKLNELHLALLMNKMSWNNPPYGSYPMDNSFSWSPQIPSDCAFDQFYKMHPEHTGPLCLHCGCKKCSPTC